MAGTLIVRLANRLEELQRLDTALTEFAKVENLASDLIMQLQLSIEEIFTNIVSYGYTDKQKHEVEIRLKYTDTSITIDIFDDAIPFNPLAPKEDVDLDKPIEDIQIGGHGINIVRSIMNGLEYEHVDGRNHLSMVRHL